MQLRRLDPLANSGPYQRLLKMPVKSVTLTEAQYERIRERQPGLVASAGDASVIGFPYRDYLYIHYGFPEVEAFRDQFADLFARCVTASSKEQAPRGVILSFRDRPNRPLANMVFWSSALEEGAEWVEMSWVAVPEQPEPGIIAGENYIVREATDRDRDVIADIEAEVSGQPRLTEAGVSSIYENARWLWVVVDRAGTPAGFLSLRTEPGGWGILEQVAIRPALLAELREPLLRWAVAWLRNNGSRRLRKHVYMSDTEDLALLRGVGFAAGETGLDYTRPVDASEVQSLIEERQSHGWYITLGDWR